MAVDATDVFVTASRLNHTDPEFHARVYLATQVLDVAMSGFGPIKMTSYERLWVEQGAALALAMADIPINKLMEEA